MVGSCCAIVGVLIISLPIPIIVNTFNKLYEKAKIKNQICKKKKLAGWTDYKKTGFAKVSHEDLQGPRKTSRFAWKQPSLMPTLLEAIPYQLQIRFGHCPKSL